MKREDLYALDLAYYFGKMKHCFLKEDADDIEGRIQFRVTDSEKPNTPEDWVVSFTNGQCAIEKATVKKPDVLVRMDKKTFIDGFVGIEKQIDIFKRQKVTMDGDQHLAMYSKILFEQPQRYDEWFVFLEHSLKKTVASCLKITYRFAIQPCDSDEDLGSEDIFLFDAREKAYRNLVIENGTCVFLPFDNIECDVEFEIDESTLDDLISGKQSYFDLLCLSKLTARGDGDYIRRFPSLFDDQCFLNGKISYVSPQMVMSGIGQAFAALPETANGKTIVLELTGERSGKYFVSAASGTARFSDVQSKGATDAIITMDSSDFVAIACGISRFSDVHSQNKVLMTGDEELGAHFGEWLYCLYPLENRR